MKHKYSPAGGLGEGWAGWAKAPARPTVLGAVAGGEEAVAEAGVEATGFWGVGSPMRMNGWLKKVSKSIRSLAFLFNSPFKRSTNSGEVPDGILWTANY